MSMISYNDLRPTHFSDRDLSMRDPCLGISKRDYIENYLRTDFPIINKFRWGAMGSSLSNMYSHLGQWLSECLSMERNKPGPADIRLVQDDLHRDDFSFVLLDARGMPLTRESPRIEVPKRRGFSLL